jgi:hypothetical protein
MARWRARRRKWAGEQGRAAGRGRRSAMQVTGGRGDNGARWSAAGCGRKRGDRGSVAAKRRQAGPAGTVSGDAV